VWVDCFSLPVGLLSLPLTTICIHAGFKVPPPSANRLRHAGYALYEGINFVVFLTQNMRARFDPEYTHILDDLRWGHLSDVQMERLNTRVQTQVTREADAPRERDSFYRPLVVCTNQLRCAINLSMVFGIARDRELPVYESLAVPCARSKHIVERLANINDNLTDRIPMKLLFFMGMPVMITRKHPSLLTADVIANGVIGTVVGTHPPLETLATIACEAAGGVIHKLIRLPEMLLIKLLNCETTLVNGFPVGFIRLPPTHISVRLTQIPNLSQASATVDQFAVVPAFACSTEKLQGKTCHDGVVVTPLDRRKTGVPFQTLYVALSRAVGLAGLTITEPITRAYLEKFKPTQAIVKEMQRLINLVQLPPYISAPETDHWKARQHS
jgi:ATP-dependent exoDNAse (exonuclease V) alpha subunit